MLDRYLAEIILAIIGLVATMLAIARLAVTSLSNAIKGAMASQSSVTDKLMDAQLKIATTLENHLSTLYRGQNEILAGISATAEVQRQILRQMQDEENRASPLVAAFHVLTQNTEEIKSKLLDTIILLAQNTSALKSEIAAQTVERTAQTAERDAQTLERQESGDERAAAQNE